MPNGLLDDASLRTHPDGLALALTLPWYRSLWLSSVSSLRLTVDGEDIPAGNLALELGGVRYALAGPARSERKCSGTSRNIRLLIATTESPVALGEQHTVRLIGELRLPYMQIAPGQDGGPGMYVPNFVNQTMELTVDGQGCGGTGTDDGGHAAPTESGGDPFSLGLTLYSASAEFRAGWYDFDGLLEPRGRARHRPRDRDRRIAGAAYLSQRD